MSVDPLTEAEQRYPDQDFANGALAAAFREAFVAGAEWAAGLGFTPTRAQISVASAVRFPSEGLPSPLVVLPFQEAFVAGAEWAAQA